MLPETKIKENLSRAHLQNVATIKGLICKDGGDDFDSVDMSIVATGKLANDSVILSPELQVQLKATINLNTPTDKPDCFAFSLPKKNYDDLRGETALPRILAVYKLPESRDDWINHTENELITKHCLYWICLKGAEENDNETSVTVYIPKENVLSPETLLALMHKISKGEEI